MKDIQKAVNLMFTDSNHLKVEDPGQVEGNVVFTYLDAFDPDVDEVANLKEFYQRGGLGDGTLKKRLVGVLETVIAPIRERRLELNNQHDFVLDVLKQGTLKALAETNQNVNEIKDAFGFFKF
jgi:tryptophanyl-tRNA synthetase